MPVCRIAVFALSVDLLLSAQALRRDSQKMQSALAPAPLSACSDDNQMCAGRHQIARATFLDQHQSWGPFLNSC